MMTLRITKSSAIILIAGIVVLAPCLSRRLVHAQDTPTVVPTGNCCCDAAGHTVRCSARSSGSSGGSTYSGLSDAEIKAEHDRELERQRLADEQRKLVEEQQREAEQEKRQEEEWKQSVAEAAASLKGVSNDNMVLKGTTDNTFGLKGVSPEEAAASSLYGIKARAPDNYSRDVSTAWKQVHCAAELTNYAVADLEKIETGAADDRELDEIKYLAGEASNSLHGNPVGVQCSAAPPMPSVKAADPAQLAPIMDKLLTRTVQDAETIVTSRQKAEVLQQKIADLNAQRSALKAQPPAAAKKEPAAQRAKPAPGSSLSADQQHINDVYQQQKENEKKKTDYLALLLETQRALNDVNSQKITSAADAERVQKETQAIMAGQLPSGPSGSQSQTQKKKVPGGDK